MRFLSRSRPRLFFFGCLVLAVYFAYTALMGAVQTHQLAEQRLQAEQELRELEDRKAYIEAVRDYVASDQYVEQEARRQLGYVREGEIPFVVIGPPVPEDKEQPKGDWWERLFPR